MASPMVAVMHRKQRARANTSRRGHRARARGDRRRLLGVQITVKEVVQRRGAAHDLGYCAVRSMRRQSPVSGRPAVILGKTIVPVALGDLQTYNPIYGTTNNPWDLE